HDFKTGDHSTNIFILGLIDFGEGWHNNHHAFPNSARFGLKWWQIDFAWLLLQLLEKIGLVNELKQPTPFQIQQKQKGNTI
ncbi:hypothetical protein EBR96_05705, partial [bacterium]|nr:hypothetical protein [bacterium]